jgi:hypothetical protein
MIISDYGFERSIIVERQFEDVDSHATYVRADFREFNCARIERSGILIHRMATFLYN